MGGMLPIFMIGFVVGMALTWAWYMYKKDTPSEIKFKLQEAEIMRYKSDNDKLYELANEHCKKIQELEAKLKEYEK